jgi:hypothetical protein
LASSVNEDTFPAFLKKENDEDEASMGGDVDDECIVDNLSDDEAI